MDKAEEIFNKYSSGAWEGLSLDLGEFKKAAEQIRNQSLEEAITACQKLMTENVIVRGIPTGIYTPHYKSGMVFVESIRNLKTNGNGSSEGGKDDK